MCVFPAAEAVLSHLGSFYFWIPQRKERRRKEGVEEEICVCLYICACVRVRVCVRRHDFAICRSKYQGFLFQTVCTCHDCNIYEHDSLQTCTGSHVHMSITNPYKSPICAHTHIYTQTPYSPSSSCTGVTCGQAIKSPSVLPSTCFYTFFHFLH